MLENILKPIIAHVSVEMLQHRIDIDRKGKNLDALIVAS